MSGSFEAALELLDGWGADHAAVALVSADGIVASIGDPARLVGWASVTKLVTACAALRAVERGDIALDEPLGPAGATIRHLLAHASGLGPEGSVPISAPERTRIYSNVGYDLLGALLEERAGQPIATVLEIDVLEPLGMNGTRLSGRPSAGLHGSLNDLARLRRELLRPGWIPWRTSRSPASPNGRSGRGRWRHGRHFRMRSSRPPTRLRPRLPGGRTT